MALQTKMPGWQISLLKIKIHKQIHIKLVIGDCLIDRDAFTFSDFLTGKTKPVSREGRQESVRVVI